MQNLYYINYKFILYYSYITIDRKLYITLKSFKIHVPIYNKSGVSLHNKKSKILTTLPYIKLIHMIILIMYVLKIREFIFISLIYILKNL